MPPSVALTSHGRTTSSQASLTISHAATSDPLYVHVSLGASARSVVGVTIGGVALEPLARATGGAWAHELWYLAAPSAGTADVVITLDASITITAAAHSVSGSDLDGVFRAFTFANASSTAPSVAVASATGDLVLDLVASDSASQVFTAGAGQTPLHAQDSLTGTADKSASSSEAGAASVTMSWTLSVSDAWAISGFSIPADGTADPVVARVSQQSVRTLSAGEPDARVSHLAVRTLSANFAATGRVAQVVVRTLSATAAAPPTATRFSPFLTGG